MFHVRELMYSRTTLCAGPDLKDSRMLLNLQKFLSGLEVMSLHAHTYSHGAKQFRCHKETPPLCVLLSSNAATKQELKVFSL
jgi:hypothetical protein